MHLLSQWSNLIGSMNHPNNQVFPKLPLRSSLSVFLMELIGRPIRELNLKTSLNNHFDCKIGKDYIIKNFKGMTFGGFAICSAFVLTWIVKSQTYTIYNNNNDWYSLEPAEKINSTYAFFCLKAIWGNFRGNFWGNFRGMSWTDLWKTYPIIDFIILGHDTGRFLGIGLAHTPIFYKKLNRYSQKNQGWIFQKSVLLMPRKFQKNTGWVFQKSGCVTPLKTEISGKFLDEFSRICQ